MDTLSSAPVLIVEPSSVVSLNAFGAGEQQYRTFGLRDSVSLAEWKVSDIQ